MGMQSSENAQLDGARVTARLEGGVDIGDRVVFDGVLESGETAPIFRAE